MYEIRDGLKIAAGFAGVIIGAGFSSGQEILQFFTNFGVIGIAGAVLCTCLFILLSREIAISGFALKSASHQGMTQFFCGRRLGRVVDILLVITLFLVYTVMITGGGSLLNQYLGIPGLYGGLLIVLLTLVLTGLSVKHMIVAVGLLVPLSLLVVLIIWIYALQNQTSDFSSLEAFALAQTNRSTNHWLISAVLYVSYNLSSAAPILVIMGGQAQTQRAVVLGSILGSLLIGVLILLTTTAMYAQLGTIAIYPMPMLALAHLISPSLGTLMALIIFGMILNSALACLYPLLMRFSSPGTIRFRVLAGAASLLGLTISSTQGFVPLVSFVYPLFGILGMLVIVAIFIKWVKTHLDQLR
ncbi:hypothetical protein KVP09_12265 [Alcaligenaceae bacterium CGII-47]|nr:hypothetical protein [Alcaligenaceae bacterium CGII-47]